MYKIHLSRDNSEYIRESLLYGGSLGNDLLNTQFVIPSFVDVLSSVPISENQDFRYSIGSSLQEDALAKMIASFLHSPNSRFIMYSIDARKKDFFRDIPRMQKIMREHTVFFQHDEVYLCLSEDATSNGIRDAIRICATNYFLGVGFRPIPRFLGKPELEARGFTYLFSCISFIVISIFDGESFAIIHVDGE